MARRGPEGAKCRHRIGRDRSEVGRSSIWPPFLPRRHPEHPARYQAMRLPSRAGPARDAATQGPSAAPANRPVQGHVKQGHGSLLVWSVGGRCCGSQSWRGEDVLARRDSKDIDCFSRGAGQGSCARKRSTSRRRVCRTQQRGCYGIEEKRVCEHRGRGPHLASTQTSTSRFGGRGDIWTKKSAPFRGSSRGSGLQAPRPRRCSTAPAGTPGASWARRPKRCVVDSVLLAENLNCLAKIHCSTQDRRGGIPALSLEPIPLNVNFKLALSP